MLIRISVKELHGATMANWSKSRRGASKEGVESNIIIPRKELITRESFLREDDHLCVEYTSTQISND